MAEDFLTSEQLLPVAIIDQDRLFSESFFGQSFNKKFQEDANTLSEENRRIEKELSDEEDALTQKRQDLPNEEFRKLAAAFNEKVEKIRSIQSKKENDLNISRLEAQRIFFAKAEPVIIELMRDRRIQFILDKKSIFIARQSSDITDSVIKHINEAIKPVTDVE